ARPPRGRVGRLTGRGTGTGSQAGRVCPGSAGAGINGEPSAVVWPDPVGLVAPGLPPPRPVAPRRGRLLVAGRLGAIGLIRADPGWLGRSRPLTVLGLPGPGRTGPCRSR